MKNQADEGKDPSAPPLLSPRPAQAHWVMEARRKAIAEIKQRRAKADSEAMRFRFVENPTWRDVDHLLAEIDFLTLNAPEAGRGHLARSS